MKKYIISIILLVPTLLVYAQGETTKGLRWASLRGLEYTIKAGFNIGGTAPVPLPEEIRSIESYNPTLAFGIEADVTKWITDKWGVETGLRLENKSMTTKAGVKNYNLAMVDKEGGYMEGRWTGYVKTKVDNTYITAPVLVTYKLTSRWRLSGGAFFSYMSEGDFSGTAYNGYLRNIDPTGIKIYVDEATYDFSGDLKRFQWGAQLGGEWKAFKHLVVSADFTWGFNNVFKKDFDIITFSLYPIYLNISFGYKF